MNPKVVAIMATCGRHQCLERSVKLFLNQDYENKHLLIYQNSEIPQKLDSKLKVEFGDKITLINNHIDKNTNQRFANLGAIYNNAIDHIPNDTDIIIFWDDDDIFLTNHISAGVEGLNKVKQLIDKKYIAYKPSRSFYRHANGIELMGNVLEPSIFVEADHIKRYGFSNTTTEQHWQWLNPLHHEQTLYQDDNGIPTLLYNWGDTNIPTFKTSGDFHNPNNFNNYRNFSQDHGDQIITPLSDDEVSKFYLEIFNWKLINNFKQ